MFARLAVTALLIVGTAQVARAATVEYLFSGTSFSILSLSGIVLPSEITSAASFQGNILIDDAIVDGSASTSVGVFSHAAVSIDVAYDTGFSASGSDGRVFQSRSPPFSSLSADTFASKGTDLVSSLTLIAVSFRLSDNDAGGQNLFTDPNVLLASLPMPSSLDGNRWVELVFSDGTGGTGYFRGNLSTLEPAPIPLPAALPLMTTGLGLLLGVNLGWNRRKRRIAVDPA